MVASIINEGRSIGEIAADLGISSGFLSTSINKHFFTPASPAYSPQLLAKARENKAIKMKESLEMPIDWDRTVSLVNEGRTLTDIARTMGVSDTGLGDRFRSRYGDPASLFYDPSLIARVRENHLRQRGERTRTMRQEPGRREEQSRRVRELWQDPEYVARTTQIWDAERREEQSRRTREMWQDPEYAAHMAQIWDAQHREEASRRTREMWQDPEFVARMTQMWQEPEYREEAARRTREMWQDPEFAARMRQMTTEMWQNPEHVERMRRIFRDPEYRRKVHENHPAQANFWQWISKFPPEKQREILRAINAKASESALPQFTSQASWVASNCKFASTY